MTIPEHIKALHRTAFSLVLSFSCFLASFLFMRDLSGVTRRPVSFSLEFYFFK
jgi:hypothetical protein